MPKWVRKITLGILLISTLNLVSTYSIQAIEDIVAVDASKEYKGYSYLENNNGITIVGYSDEAITDVIIPKEINGKPVIEIASESFAQKQNITSIVIPSTVKKIGDLAFSWCSNLETVRFSEGLEEVGFSAFIYCSKLKEVQLPDSLHKIDESMFMNCSDLTNVNMSDNIEKIGDGAFKDCQNLKEIKMPKNLKEVGRGCFINCNLSKVELPESVTSIGEDAFLDCKNLESIKLNDNIESIGARVFSNCVSLKSIELPSKIKSIEPALFYNCTSLESAIIPSNVTTIGEKAFSSCEKIKSINLPRKVESIGNEAFSGCKNLSKLELSDNIQTIGTGAFLSCEVLENIKIPKKITIINQNLFKDCIKLKNIEMNSEITTIDKSAFENCKALETIRIPEGVTVIAQRSFYGCENLKEVEIPINTTRIDSEAFKGCKSLLDITIPSKVELLGQQAFEECSKLKKVKLSKIKSLENGLFKNCTELEEVILSDKTDTISENVFQNCTSLKKILMPKSIEFIDLSSFDKKNDITFSCYKGTMADSYINFNKFVFKYLDSDNKNVITIYSGTKRRLIKDEEGNLNEYYLNYSINKVVKNKLGVIENYKLKDQDIEGYKKFLMDLIFYEDYTKEENKDILSRIYEEIKELPTGIIEELYDNGVKIKIDDDKAFNKNLIYEEIPKNTVAYYSHREGIIHFSNTAVSRDGVIIHEIGHVYDYEIINETDAETFTDTSEEFKKIFDSDEKVALFKEKNPLYMSGAREYFAECFSLYFINRNELIKKAPNTYKFFETNLKKYDDDTNYKNHNWNITDEEMPKQENKDEEIPKEDTKEIPEGVPEEDTKVNTSDKTIPIKYLLICQIPLIIIIRKSVRQGKYWGA